MADRIDALNRLLQLHHRSMPVYLSDTRPWSRRNHDAAKQTLGQIAADHRRIVERIHAAIDADGGEIGFGRFPMDFTSLHDLSLDWLLGHLVEHQRQMIAAIEKLSAQHPSDPLIAESLGMAQGHLESLEELSAIQPKAA